ncbi:MAG: spermidine synthase [Proteobacteria bacterium]|nr:spermidine synthase [Pseudomonadota bacterium]
MFGKKKPDSFARKKRYRGKLVHQCSDDIGVIEVVDHSSNRSLHFGSKEKQSSMNLNAPHDLILSYTQTMMAGLLLMRPPGSVLNVGLGGGSIPKFLLHHYPECRIDVVELREKVVDVAFKYFQVPNDHRLNIFIADAKEFIRKIRSKTYDMIILDVYTQFGMSDSIRGYPFINACKNRLNPNGIININLWSEPETVFKNMVSGVSACFNNLALQLPVADRTNHIVFGLNRSKFEPSQTQLKKRSQVLEKAFNIGLPDMFDRLCDLNPYLLNR